MGLASGLSCNKDKFSTFFFLNFKNFITGNIQSFRVLAEKSVKSEKRQKQPQQNNKNKKLKWLILGGASDKKLFFPVGIYLLNVNNRNIKNTCEICSKSVGLD